jgi:amino acid transporter
MRAEDKRARILQLNAQGRQKVLAVKFIIISSILFVMITLIINSAIIMIITIIITVTITMYITTTICRRPGK